MPNKKVDKKTNNKKIAIFEGRKIRRIWDDKKEKWYFSVVDIVAILTNQTDFQLARNYWKVLKNRLKKEGSEVVTKCNRLKMEAEYRMGFESSTNCHQLKFKAVT